MEGGDWQANRSTRKADGGSGQSLLRGNQHAQHRGGHADHDDDGQQQPVLPPGHVGFPVGHVGPETLKRSLKVGLQCLHSLSRTEIRSDSSWFVASAMFPSYPIPGAFTRPVRQNTAKFVFCRLWLNWREAGTFSVDFSPSGPGPLRPGVELDSGGTDPGVCMAPRSLHRPAWRPQGEVRVAAAGGGTRSLRDLFAQVPDARRGPEENRVASTGA